MTYNHDHNLRNLYWTLQYDPDGRPEIRVVARAPADSPLHVLVDNSDPIPVTLGSNSITITGNVNVGTTITVVNTVEDPVITHITEVGTSGILTVPWLPVGGNVNAAVTGSVTANQGTNPWIIRGNVNAVVSGNVVSTISGNINIGTMPEVEIKNDVGNPIPVSKNTTQNSNTNPIFVEGVNNASFFAPTQSDSFGRLRTSNPQTLYDSQARYYDHQQFSNAVVGTGNVVYNANSSTFNMNVGTGATDSVFCETTKVFPYQPGKSLLVFSTFCMNAAKTNLRQRIGYFSAQNGIYFENNAGTLYMVIRSSSTGSLLEERIAQSDWNGDTLLGGGGSSNPSGIDLDTELIQIFWTDIEWLGAGSVRVGFVINGTFIVCHTFNHANTPSKPGETDNTTTYMTTASLPLRWEITNTGSTTSSSALKIICSSVISEGGYTISGTPRSIGHNLGSPITLPNDVSFKPLIAIRLKSSMLDAVVLPTFFTIAPTGQSNFKYRIYSRAITSGGTWVDVSSGGDSPVQYNLSPTSIANGTIVTENFIISSNQTSSSSSQIPFGFEVQLQRNPFTNSAYEYVLSAATTGTNETVYAALEWQEIT
jgi:hypothetical protein